MSTASNQEKKDSSAGARKPYNKPKLDVYGDLREITQSNAAGAKLDGMSGTGMQQTV